MQYIFYTFLILCVVAAAFYKIFIIHFNKIKILNCGFYEVCSEVKSDREGYVISSVIMICEPEKSETALKNQIKDYLQKNNIVGKITKQYNDNKQVYMSFIQPTEFWNVGDVSNENEKFEMCSGMCIAGLLIDLETNDYQWQNSTYNVI